jgi:hypothetical protein
VDAGITNEMSNCLGDFIIATDEPFVLKTFGDPKKPLVYNESKHTVTLTTLRYEFYSKDVLIADEFERKLAAFLYLNAPWNQDMPTAMFDGDELRGIETKCWLPAAPDDDEVDLVFLGAFSSMLSWEYVRTTSDSGRVARLTPPGGPEQFGIRIPKDYVGKQLQLIRARVKPGSPRKKS